MKQFAPAGSPSGTRNRLSASDHNLLLKCISELHGFPELAALRLWLLESALPRLIPSDWLSYNEVDLATPENTFSLMRPESELLRSLLPRFAELSHQHPVIARQMNRNDCSVRKISDFLSRGQYHRLDLYPGCLPPSGGRIASSWACLRSPRTPKLTGREQPPGGCVRPGPA